MWQVPASKYEYGVSNRGYRLDLRAGNTLAFLVSPDGASSDDYSLTVVPTVTLTTGAWYHLAGVFDAQARTLALYLDGERIGSRPVAYDHIYLTTAPFMLGADVYIGSAGHYFDGRLDEWRVYDRPLSGAEVQALMATSPPQVDFEAAPLSGTAPLTVAFTNLTGGTAVYAWDFGDGVTSTLVSPQHTYAQGGVYTVSLAAEGPGGGDALTRTQYIHVDAGFDQTLLATIVAAPDVVLVEQQPIQVSVVVTNVNDVTVDEVRPWLEADGAHRVSGPQPVSATLAAGAGVTFTLSYTASTAGTLTWQGAATGTTAGITATAPITTSNPVQVIGMGRDWVERRPGLSPSARFDHAMAYDSRRGVVVLQGGIGAGGVLSDTWEYSGLGDWMPVDTGQSPSPRRYHAMAYDSARGVVVLYGGYTAGGVLSDTWEYDGQDWSLVDTPAGPPPLYAHGMAYDSSREVVVLHGGLGAGGVLSDTWEYDGQDWSLVDTSVTAPGGAGHPMVYDSARGVMVLTGTSDEQFYLADTWEYDGSDWVRVLADPELSPPIRSSMRMAYDAELGKAVLFGGRNPAASEYEPSTWGYDGTWSSLDPDHHPIGRAGHALAYDSRRGKVILFGGERFSAYYLADTWEYGVFTRPVRAGFSADPITGSARLAVSFTNDSSGAVDSLVWDYGDGITGTTSALTHTHVYTWPGVYTVTLRVEGLGGSDVLTRTHYITVTYPITSRVITYTYDPLYRLTGAGYSTGEFFTYTYDAAGNRSVFTETVGESQTVHSYQYDHANRLVTVDGQAYTWDDNGNLLFDGARTFAYDAANRLTQVASGTLTTTFEYDGLGNRTSQTVNGVTTDYVLDVAGGLPEVIIATTGGANTYHVQIQDQVLGQQEAGAWVYVAPDALGSVRQLADADGQVTLVRSYDPFGRPFGSAGSGASEFGYTGEWWQAEPELLHLRARWYDPGVGRFLSEDTNPGIAYLPKSLHIYVYAWNNPVLLTDHSGLQPQPPECDDPTQICYTGTSGPQVTPSSPEVTTPPTTPEPSDGAGSGHSTMTSPLEWCYTLPVEDREGCVGKVLELPPWKYPAGPVCPPPEPQVFLTSGIAGDPIGSAGMGQRKYSYRKTSSQQVKHALFLGGADDPYDRLALVGGTYLSRLTAEVVVYENGMLSKLYEEYDARNLAGLAVGVDISVARSVDVRLEGGFIYGPYLFGVVSAGESGISEQKDLWISTDRRSVLHEAVMHGAVSAENSLALPGGGYGWSYSLNLRP